MIPNHNLEIREEEVAGTGGKADESIAWVIINGYRKRGRSGLLLFEQKAGGKTYIGKTTGRT